MAGDLPRPSLYAGALSPDEVRRRSFSTGFRGFDQSEVKDYLHALAEEMRRTAERESELLGELREARERAARPRLDEETLTEALGHEAAQILHSAHEAGADIRRKAEENAARILRDAHAQADSIRHSAESLLSERTAEAEAAAEAIRAAAHAEATAVVSRARAEAEAALSEARARFDAMGEEAESFKNRLLGDLSRRRRVMLAQVEQLTAGRDSMLRAVSDVRGLIDQVTGSLESLESEARSAADHALDSARRRTDLETISADLPPAPGLGAAALGAPPPPPESVLRIQPAPDTEQEAPPVVPLPPTTASPTTPSPAPPAAEAMPPAVAPMPPTQARVPAPELSGTPNSDTDRAVEVLEAPEHDDVSPAQTARTERRSSGLRILRRGRPDEGRHPSLELSELDEGVRIIRPPKSAETEPAGPGPTESGLAESGLAESGPAESGPAGTGADGPDPMPEVPRPTEPTEPTTIGLHLVSTGEDAVGDAPPEGADEVKPRVDELFARLRAERAAAVDEANQVLSRVGPPEPGPAPRSGDQPEPGVGPDQEPPAALDSPAATQSGPAQSQPDEPQPAQAEGPLVGQDAGGSTVDGPEADSTGEDTYLQRRNDLLAPVQDRLSRKLKRSLQDDQNDLLDRVRNSFRQRVEPALVDADAHRRVFSDAVRPLLEEAAARGIDFAGPASEPTTTSPSSAEVVELAVALAEDLLGQLRPRLEEVLSRSDLDDASMAEGVGAVYRSWKGERAEALAMDHAVAAFNAGILSVTEAAVPLRWVVDDDGGPCPDCDDNELAGAVPAGEAYPTGQVRPPAHPGCRCLLLPALT